MKKIGVLSIRGLPARHGAFEQATDQLVRNALENEPGLHFYVECTKDLASESYDLPNVTRMFFNRKNGIGVVLYGLKGFVRFYCQGVRTFLFMGYGMAPFFWLFQLLGCKLICNVDGFEWRRAKWGKWPRRYFRLCETLASKSNATLIYDSIGVARYYSINHHRSGRVLFYGTEKRLIPPHEGSLSKGHDYLVVVMRMEPENHILEIVKGFLASESNLRLILVGPETSFFSQIVKPLIDQDANERISWLGPIYDREKLLHIRSNAKAYIHGHSVGGTNPTLVEACWIRRPIIAYNSIFNKEVLGKDATYFSTQDDLTKILNGKINEITPPELDERYTWEYVSAGYIESFK